MKDYDYFEYENGIIRLSGALSLLNYVHMGIAEGQNQIDEEQLDSALTEISLSLDETLKQLKQNFESLLEHMRGEE